MRGRGAKYGPTNAPRRCARRSTSSPNAADTVAEVRVSPIGPAATTAPDSEQQHVGHARRDLLEVVGDHHQRPVAGSRARSPSRATSDSRPPRSRPAHGSSKSSSSGSAMRTRATSSRFRSPSESVASSWPACCRAADHRQQRVGARRARRRSRSPTTVSSAASQPMTHHVVGGERRAQPLQQRAAREADAPARRPHVDRGRTCRRARSPCPVDGPRWNDEEPQDRRLARSVRAQHDPALVAVRRSSPDRAARRCPARSRPTPSSSSAGGSGTAGSCPVPSTGGWRSVGYRRPVGDVDAVVIGAGPNGLVAANLLADAGWRVLVLEAQPEPGGAVRSAELTHPGFVHDLFSAFYPLGVASPVMRVARPRVVRPAVAACAHRARAPDRRRPLRGAVDRRRRDRRVARHVRGRRRRRVARRSRRVPPGERAAARRDDGAVPAGAGPGAGWRRRSGRAACSSSRASRCSRCAAGPGAVPRRGRRAAAHRQRAAQRRRARRPPERLPRLDAHRRSGSSTASRCPKAAPASSPPRSSAGSRSGAASVRCSRPVARIVVRDRRAVAVVLADGETIDAPRGVLADVGAPALYRDLVGEEHLPRARASTTSAASSTTWRRSRSTGRCRVRSRGAPSRRHAPAPSTSPTAWIASRRYAADLAQDKIPAHPFVLVGQMNKADPTRSPGGHRDGLGLHPRPAARRAATPAATSAASGTRETEAFADRIEAEIEAHAPGFRSLRHRPARARPARARGARRQPRGRRARRRHDGVLPAARVPARPRARPGRDPDPRAVPRVGLGAPRRRGARRVRRQRRPRRARRRPHPPPRRARRADSLPAGRSSQAPRRRSRRLRRAERARRRRASVGSGAASDGEARRGRRCRRGRRRAPGRGTGRRPSCAASQASTRSSACPRRRSR